ncbi:MAG: hypothetical protein JO022_16815 [Acidobacteriaceae bacterium]|nr:hypothetical protein [Acidobacteriaceae bacterium]
MADAARITNGLRVDEVRERFAEWRRTRAKKARIPDELWDAAVALARRNGVNRTAQTLHLDGGKLMRRMVAGGSESERKPEDAPTAFLELVSSQPDVGLECVVEAERPGVGTVRVQLKAVTMREIAELSRALLSLS